MSLAPEYPSELTKALATIGLAHLLDNYVARPPVGTRYLEIERAAAKSDLRFDYEHGNIYGRLCLVPATSTVAPKMRLITKNDHAAVFGSKRRVA